MLGGGFRTRTPQGIAETKGRQETQLRMVSPEFPWPSSHGSITENRASGSAYRLTARRKGRAAIFLDDFDRQVFL